MWTKIDDFKKRVDDKEIKIGVVGLGYVGLNVAVLFAKNGYDVRGYDISEEKINTLKSGKNPIPEEQWITPVIPEIIGKNFHVSTEIFNGLDVVFVCVPTPMRNSNVEYSYVKNAFSDVSKILHKGMMVVLESTVMPGTTENILKSILEKSGLKAGEDFGLCMSPERVDPGNKTKFIWNIPKVVGGHDASSTEALSYLYSQVIEEVVPVSSPTTAEFTKCIENVQRDVNIGLTNLFAKLADVAGIDVEEALDAASTKFNFMRLKPGCGVGGECMKEVSQMMKELGESGVVDVSLIESSRKVNESMPDYTVRKVVDVAGDKKKVAVLGMAYKKDSSSTKNSPAIEVLERLKKLGFDLKVYDPFVVECDGFSSEKSLEEAMDDRDIVVIATDHSCFADLKLDVPVVDGRNILERRGSYCGIGR